MAAYGTEGIAGCVSMYALIYSPGDPIVLASVFIVTCILLNIGYSTFLVYPMGLADKE
jgi:ACS family glucarate transporter-like MFS transporter